jgi:hypothetical protein
MKTLKASTCDILRMITKHLEGMPDNELHGITSAVAAGGSMGDDPVMSQRKLVIDGQEYLIQVHKLEKV